MGFSEKTKLIVKKKAMFQCCWCKKVNIDVHHIKPQEHGGSDDISNAAPLCQSCHDLYGDNPSKRKQIKQMRDHWYETVEKMYSPNSSAIIPKIEQIDKKLNEHSTNLGEMKDILKEISDEAINKMTLGTVNVVASNITNASGASLSNVRPENVLPMKYCSTCYKGYFPAKVNDKCYDPSCDGVVS